MIRYRKLRKKFVLQQGMSDCGIACLASIVKFYGGEMSLEKLREYSGTTPQGTSLLGLLQAANVIGFSAEGYESTIENLKKIETPVILHVNLPTLLSHYVVCYGYNGRNFVVGDPGEGIKEIDVDSLKGIWKSKCLLALRPGQSFESRRDLYRKKKLWFVSLVKEDVLVLLSALFLGIILTVLGLSTAIFSKKLIDDILPNADWDKLRLGIFLLSVIVVGNNLLAYLRSFLVMKQNRDFNVRIVNQFYRRLLFLPKSFFDSRKTGEIISRMNDSGRIQKVISFLLGNMIISLLVLAVSTGYTFIYSVDIGVIYLLSIPTYLLLAVLYHKKLIYSNRQVMSAAAASESNFIDSLQGIEAIKSLNRQSSIAHQTKIVFEDFQKKSFQLGKISITYGLMAGLIGAVFSLSVIALLSFAVMRGEMTLGEMVALLTVSGSIIPSVNSLTSANAQLQEAKVAFERMFEVASIDPEFSEKSNDMVSIEEFRSLQVEQLNFGFPGQRALLREISFQLQKGEIIALLGENGCGKSTLLQILQKFYAVDSPFICVNNEEWRHLNPKKWRNKVSCVPQNIKIFNANVIGNISLTADASERERVVRWCAEWGFTKYFERFPQGLFTLLGEEGINISGGQKQLVALARALYRNPQLLLLDEATSAMDRETENGILPLLDQHRQSMGIILVTHRIRTAKKADRIYVVEEGVTTCSGTHDQLLQTRNLYSKSFYELIGD